ncbi:hypothetical protein T03_8185 [Trichinella britovi]|uniref:Uncharacterized protein n=1 Tax=Trichinella britovi TaxID=45882 RepID=A0A0V1CJM9_TRIBR|nr:hypothetical protein T03_8185 [Trichinella britovi]
MRRNVKHIFFVEQHTFSSTFDIGDSVAIWSDVLCQFQTWALVILELPVDLVFGQTKIIHDSWKQGRENFLFLQHLAPCSSVAKNQAELLMKHGLCLITDHIHFDHAEPLIEGMINLIKTTKQKIRNFAADNLVFVMNYVPGLFYRPASIVILTGGTARRRFQHGDLATDLPMKQKEKNIADIQLPSDDEPSESASQESSVFVFQSVTGYVTRQQRNHQQSTWMRNYVI